MHALKHVAWCLLLAACGGTATNAQAPASQAAQASIFASDQAKPVARVQAAKQPDLCANTLGVMSNPPGVGTMLHAQGADEAFSLDTAVYISPGNTSFEKLQKELVSVGLERANDTDNGELPCAVTSGEAPPERTAPLLRASRALVKMPKLNGTSSVSITEFNNHLPPGSLVCDAASVRALRSVQNFNSAHSAGKGARLIPNRLTRSAQILTGTAEADNSSSSSYSDIMNLRRAWQLRQFVTGNNRGPVRAAVVDLGFDAGGSIAWDTVIDDGSGARSSTSFGHAAPDEEPWHGNSCASTLNATVNDHRGCAGSALLGTKSQVPLLVSNGPRVKTIAVQPHDASAETLVSGIECAVWKGRADVVSVSRVWTCEGANCAGIDEPLTDVLEYAAQFAVPVFFASGNDGRLIGPENPNLYSLGCSTPGGLCVGGIASSRVIASWPVGFYSKPPNGLLPSDSVSVERVPDEGLPPDGPGPGEGSGSENRFPCTDDHSLRSGCGSAVTLWGPATTVQINSDPGGRTPQYGDGTSLATPYIAGIVALAQSAWTAPVTSRDEFVRRLTDASTTRSPDPRVQPGILDAYALMRGPADAQRVKIAADARDTAPNANNQLPRQPGKPLEPTELLTLHTPQDVDYLPVSAQSNCLGRNIVVTYLDDESLGKLAVAAVGTDGKPFVQRASNDTKAKFDVTTTTPASGQIALKIEPRCGGFYLRISQTGRLTTGYSVDIQDAPVRTGPAE
ncbi:MAG: S8/S53 family peptidase [Polyangiaceae bacterium]